MQLNQIFCWHQLSQLHVHGRNTESDLDSSQADHGLSRAEQDLLASANGDVLLLGLNGPFTYGSAKGMVQLLTGRGGGYRCVVFDFSESPMIDGSIAMAVEELLHQARDERQTVIVSGEGGPAVEVLDRMGVLGSIPQEHRVSDRLTALELAVAAAGTTIISP